MSITARLRSYYLAHFSKPAADRPIYRLIRRERSTRIVEFGIGAADRAARMIAVAQQASPGQRVVYTAIDWFEMRSSDVGECVSLKLVHRRLRATGASVRLLPGDPFTVLSQRANLLGRADLILLSEVDDIDSMANACFYLPRMMRPGAHVLERHVEGSTWTWKSLSLDAIEHRAGTRRARRRAA